MIFTIGYQQVTPAYLGSVLKRLDARLIDVRSYPTSRKAGLSGGALRESLGDRYVWAGKSLGGRGRITATGIEFLKQFERGSDPNVVLMCMEHAPGECHRHTTICAVHFPKALHIFEGELIQAGELQRSIEQDDDYAVHSPLPALG